MSILSDAELSRATEFLAAARSVVVFTGAGVSAESGIPTYRSGSDGLWSVQNMERFANPEGYARNLPDSYRWYMERARGIAGALPNAAHFAISQLAELVPSMTLVTQNIDSLHQRAGSHGVLELHGNLREVRCEACPARIPWPAAPAEPRCAGCGGTLRPDVVMFGELLPQATYAAAEAAAASCDVLISVGTSHQVYPASGLPLVALQCGARVLVVNPDMNGHPRHASVLPLPGAAGAVMPLLVGRVSQLLKTRGDSLPPASPRQHASGTD